MFEKVFDPYLTTAFGLACAAGGVALHAVLGGRRRDRKLTGPGRPARLSQDVVDYLDRRAGAYASERGTPEAAPLVARYLRRAAEAAAYTGQDSGGRVR